MCVEASWYVKGLYLFSNEAPGDSVSHGDLIVSTCERRRGGNKERTLSLQVKGSVPRPQDIYCPHIHILPPRSDFRQRGWLVAEAGVFYERILCPRTRGTTWAGASEDHVRFHIVILEGGTCYSNPEVHDVNEALSVALSRVEPL